VEFRVLGPLEVVDDTGSERRFVRRKQQMLLGLLLLRANQEVDTATIADQLWGVQRPKSAAANLHSYVSSLRKMLDSERLSGHERLECRRGVYRLRIDDDELDAQRFARLTKQARGAVRQGHLDGAASLFGAALGTWRGTVLGQLPVAGPVQVEALRLEESRLTVAEDRIECWLELGQYDAAIIESRTLTERYPTRERLWGLRMQALYHAQRQAEALSVYRQAYALLDREAGIRPGAALRRLHQRILAGDPGLGTRQARASAVPSQLPLPPRLFVGRDVAMAKLDEGVADVGSRAVVVAVTGGPAIGKTAVALRWAHRAGPRFPDGQLYADLHGYAEATAVDPVSAVRRFLVALGVSAADVPADPESAVGLYRTVLRDRQVLLVLDNVACTEQIRPLLPSTSGSMAVVTSRNRLTGLDVLWDACRINLDALRREDALTLLADVVGERRIAVERAAAEQLVNRCGGVPLAVRLAGAKLVNRPDLSIRDYLDEFTGREELSLFALPGKAELSIKSVFDMSYVRLSVRARQVYSMFGSVQRQDVTVSDAAAYVHVGSAHARMALDELVSEHLIEERVGGRFSCHALLRSYARSLGDRRPGVPEPSLSIVPAHHDPDAQKSCGSAVL
jgi:DNA-binding SARP family transcriptional activator